MCFLQRHDLIGTLRCLHRGSCFTCTWPFGKWSFMGFYLSLCTSGLSPLKLTDVKIWVNKELRPAAVIPALLLLFRLGFQTRNCSILFPVIWECGKGLSCNKRKNRCRLALQSCSMVPGQVAVAGFQLSCHSEWLSYHCSKTPSFATSVPLSGSSNNDNSNNCWSHCSKRLCAFLTHGDDSKSGLPQCWRY